MTYKRGVPTDPTLDNRTRHTPVLAGLANLIATDTMFRGPLTDDEMCAIMWIATLLQGGSVKYEIALKPSYKELGS